MLFWSKLINSFLLGVGLLRCGKSCRLRWLNYLRPDLKRGLLSESEEKLVVDLHAQLGNRFLFLSFILSLYFLLWDFFLFFECELVFS
jgi:hypothetical protein